MNGNSDEIMFGKWIDVTLVIEKMLRKMHYDASF